MTDAERQRRRRKRVAKESLTSDRKIVKAAQRARARADYMPMPVGIYYWRTVTVRTADGREIEVSVPHQRPLADVDGRDLTDDDVLALLDRLHGIARDRSLDLSRLPAYPAELLALSRATFRESPASP